MVIKVNSIVNEKYLCQVDDKGNFTHKLVKFRTTSNTTVNGEIPSTVDDDPLYNICMDIKESLESQGKLVTKSTMKSQVIKDINAGLIDGNLRPGLIKYIQSKCPEDLGR